MECVPGNSQPKGGYRQEFDIMKHTQASMLLLQNRSFTRMKQKPANNQMKTAQGQKLMLVKSAMDSTWSHKLSI